MAKRKIKCDCCVPYRKKHPTAPKGHILTAEGNPIKCPYCDGTTFRMINVPDPSHRMQRKWHTEILAPVGTPRFYSVRECIACGEREERAAAGHFFNGLLAPCIATNKQKGE